MSCFVLGLNCASVQAAGIDELKRRGDANGVPLEKITRAEAEELEPLVKTHEVALWSPSTSAADPTEVTRSLAQDAKDEGVRFVLGTKYLSGSAEGRVGEGCVVRTDHGTMETGHMINCAGLYADRVAHDFGFGKDLVMLPFKGLYMYCNSVPLKRLIYPVPDLKNPFLGVHFTVTVDGHVKVRILLHRHVVPLLTHTLDLSAPGCITSSCRCSHTRLICHS
jgi:L-2-hydroxyglutarate oxidase LhgO